MKSVPVARAVPQEQWRGPMLAGGVAAREELRERRREVCRIAAEARRPRTRDRGERHVERATQALDEWGKRRREVAIAAATVAVPSHVDGGAEEPIPVE